MLRRREAGGRSSSTGIEVHGCPCLGTIYFCPCTWFTRSIASDRATRNTTFDLILMVCSLSHRSFRKVTARRRIQKRTIRIEISRYSCPSNYVQSRWKSRPEIAGPLAARLRHSSSPSHPRISSLCTTTREMSPSPAPALTTTSRKRPRPVHSCLHCRSKMLKCDRQQPCGQCSKHNRNVEECVYNEHAGSLGSFSNAERDDAGPSKRPRTLNVPSIGKGHFPNFNTPTLAEIEISLATAHYPEFADSADDMNAAAKTSATHATPSCTTTGGIQRAAGGPSSSFQRLLETGRDIDDDAPPSHEGANAQRAAQSKGYYGLSDTRSLLALVSAYNRFRDLC